MLTMHAIAHGGVQTHEKESALTVDSGRKIPCGTRELNLHQQQASPTLPTEPHPHHVSYQSHTNNIQKVRQQKGVPSASQGV